MDTEPTTSFFIAKLLGPTFTLIGLSVLLREHTFRTILRDVIRSAPLLYFSGLLSLISGLALILTHNIWRLDWRLLITILGWAVAVRGFVTLFQPQWSVALVGRLVERREIFYSAAAANLLVGLALIYVGYF